MAGTVTTKNEERIYLHMYNDRGVKRYQVTRTMGTELVEVGDWIDPPTRSKLMKVPGLKVITDKGQ